MKNIFGEQKNLGKYSMKESKDLTSRKNLFKKNFFQIKSKKNCDLIYTYKIQPRILKNFLFQVKNFIVSPLKPRIKNKLINENNWSKILKIIIKERPLNITHNGLFVPKREISLEYNLMLKSFVDLLKSIGLDKKIKYFIGPPQIRIKFGIKKKKFMPNSSEFAHSDAWTEINTKSCSTLFFPLAGDCENNYVNFFYPNKNYNDKWLERRFFKDGHEMIKNYKRINIKYEKTACIVADSSILHQSVTNMNSKPRLSMDIGIIPKNFKRNNYSYHTNHLSYESINQIGKSKIMAYKDSVTKNIKKSKSGTKTQANRELLLY